MTATAQNFNDSATPPPFPAEVVTQFLRFARDGNETGVTDMLKKHGKSIVFVRDEDKKGPVTHAAETGRKNVLYALVVAGASIDERDGDMRTPLMSASRRGYVSMVKTLIDLHANLEAKDSQNWTPVMHAAHRDPPPDDDSGKPKPVVMPPGKMAVLNLMLAAGVTLDGVDKNGHSITKQLERGRNTGALDVVRVEMKTRADAKADFERRLRKAIDGFREGYETDLAAPPRAVFKKKYPSPHGPLD